MEKLWKISTWSVVKVLASLTGEFLYMTFRCISKKKIKLFILTNIRVFCGRTSFLCIRVCSNEAKNTTDQSKKTL